MDRGGAGTGTRILVVEDVQSASREIQNSLTELGYVVTAAVATAAEALEHVAAAKPDLVLMDILLPGDMDGISAADVIRREHAIPVVYLTGYADERTIQRAKLTRPFGILVKPYDRSRLQAVIEIALHNHSAEGQRKEPAGRWGPILDAVLDGLIATDDRGMVCYINPAAQAITGWKESDAIGRSMTDIFPVSADEQLSLTDSSVSKAFANQAFLLSHQGNRIPVEYSLGMIRSATSRASMGFVVVFRNTSERKHVEDALTESRRKYKELVNSIDGIVWEADPEAERFTFVSKHAYRILGYPPDRWLTEPGFLRERLHREDRERVGDFWRRAHTASGGFELEYRLLAADGRVAWFRDIITVVAEKDQPACLRGVMVDITELKLVEDELRKAQSLLEKRVEERTQELSRTVAELKQQITERQRAEQALRESEERYALAARGANDGLWDWNLKTNYVYFSQRWKSMLGWADDQIGDGIDEWFMRVHPDDIQDVKRDLDAHMQNLTAHFENEHRILHKDGTYRWMLTRGMIIRDAEDKPLRMAGSQTDITERKLAEEQLLHDAFHDGLTNLPNRALFLDRLDRANSRLKRRESFQFAVLALDVDRFKVVNDSLGHAVGDQLLIAMSRRLEACLRPGDTVARLGGDEFAVLLEDISGIKDAINMADRIRQDLQTPFNLGGNEVFTTVSLGIAPGAQTYERAEDILRDADTAMFRAKSRGPARHEVFDYEMHARAVELLQLETDLRYALQRNQFFVLYQPIVSLDSGKITGFEALIRWQHPVKGTVLPDQLIPVAEETGLIVPIGRWVLEHACRQMQTWRRQFPDRQLSLSVNISSKQLAQPELLADIRRIVSDTALDPTLLALEITESVIMENAEMAAEIFSQLRSLKLRLHVDDFGTGYSSLSYLHRFPVNTLKIDRSFVSGIDEGEENSEIVRTIVTLARNLKMQVIAEGVESQQQLDHLRSLGCDMAQGFFFYRPLADADVQRLLESQN